MEFLAYAPRCNVWAVWKSNGSRQGTIPVNDDACDIDAPDGEPPGFAPLGADALFTAFNVSSGRELWLTDGTSAGTHLVKDIYP